MNLVKPKARITRGTHITNWNTMSKISAATKKVTFFQVICLVSLRLYRHPVIITTISDTRVKMFAGRSVVPFFEHVS